MASRIIKLSPQVTAQGFDCRFAVDDLVIEFFNFQGRSIASGFGRQAGQIGQVHVDRWPVGTCLLKQIA